MEDSKPQNIDGSNSAESSRVKISHRRELVLILVILALLTTANLIYAFERSSFFTDGSPVVYILATLILIVSAAGLSVTAAISFMKAERSSQPIAGDDSKVKLPLGRVISESFLGGWKVVLASGAAYAIFFAFLEGILIYQPKVNFFQYLSTHVSGSIEWCCGPAGFIPVGLVYFPAQHFGLELIPASIILMILISSLVGLNVSLLFSALKATGKLGQASLKAPGAENVSIPNTPTSRFATGAVGAAFGLFAGCPTCAASFFLSMIAGSGATVFSATISIYQPLILALTIPLLVASILLQAKSISRYLQGCSS
jgi:hypothetical protein